MRNLFVAIILIFTLVAPTYASANSSTSTVATKNMNKYGYSTVNRTVYVKESTKGKKLGMLKKKINIYIYSSHNGWYKVKFNNKTGYIQSKYLKIGFSDGWKAPVLKSKWSPNMDTNYKTLQNELGFKDDGSVYSVPGYPKAIVIADDNSSKSPYELDIIFYGWDDSEEIPATYRVPIVAKELFKLYFGSDATRV